MNGVPVAFDAVLHQPNRIQNLKRGSRLVVLPDYQGIGIGYALSSFIAKYYADKGFIFDVVTSAKNLIYKLNKSSDWKLMNWGVQTSPNVLCPNGVRNRKIASFRYVGVKVLPKYSKYLTQKKTMRVAKRRHKTK